MEKPYHGHIFLVTRVAKYRITIPADLASRPLVQKWSSRSNPDKPVHVGVTDTLRGGHTLGITSLGLFQYHQPANHKGLPLPIEEIPARLKANGITKTTRIFAMFFEHRSAETCFETTSVSSEEIFDPRWWVDTKNVLTTLGTEHPLVTISVPQTKYGVPRYL